MGFFSGMRQRRAERMHQRRINQHQLAHDQWRAEEDELTAMLTIVRDCMQGRASNHFVDMNDYGFMISNDEFPMMHLEGAAYLEIVRSPTRYSGGYGGVSFPIFGRVRVNTGRTGGKVIPGDESITMTDQGNALLTNERIMFAGSKRTHEWRLDKMISMSHMPKGYTVFAASGRGKPTGLGYGTSVASDVQFRLELAAAMAMDTLERFEAELVNEQNHHRGEEPVPPPPFLAPS